MTEPVTKTKAKTAKLGAKKLTLEERPPWFEEAAREGGPRQDEAGFDAKLKKGAKPEQAV